MILCYCYFSGLESSEPVNAQICTSALHLLTCSEEALGLVWNSNLLQDCSPECPVASAAVSCGVIAASRCSREAAASTWGGRGDILAKLINRTVYRTLLTANVAH